LLPLASLPRILKPAVMKSLFTGIAVLLSSSPRLDQSISHSGLCPRGEEG
jgi:hypothetical protein